MSARDAIVQEVTSLAALDLQGLRATWRQRWGAPPKLRSPELLRRLMAWRIQAAALGGLDPETRRRLGPTLTEVLTGPPRRLKPAEIEECIRRIEELEA